MRRRLCIFATALALVMAVTACSGGTSGVSGGGDSGGSDSGTVSSDGGAASGAEIEVPTFSLTEFPVLDGSTATLPLGRMLYRMSTGASELDAAEAVNFSKTTGSYIRLMEEEADLVIAYEAGELAKEDSRYADLEIKPIGLDALVFLCNEKNPVSSLSTEQIQGIYSGTITNWKEVGGSSEPVIPFQRPENSGSQTLMEKLMMKDVPMMEAPETWTSGEMGELVEAVASYDNTSNALGYSVYYYANYMYSVPGVRFMAVDNVMPANNTIRSGEYGYINPFYVAIRSDAPQDSPQRKLFDWMTGEDGQSLVNALGYVGVDASSKALPDMFAVSNAVIDTGDERLVINADIYNGNAGVIVFDRNLKPVKYMSNIRIPGGESYAIARSNLLPATEYRIDQDDGLPDPASTGLYDIEAGSWVIAPEYGNVRYFNDGAGSERYYLYTYDYDVSEEPVALDVADKSGQMMEGYRANEEELYMANQRVDPDICTSEYNDDSDIFYYSDSLRLYREYDYNNDYFLTELYIDDKLTETAHRAFVSPLEMPSSPVEEVPYNYIGINMYDIVDMEDYTAGNNKYILIDDKGQKVYRVDLAPNESVLMARKDYCIIVESWSGDLYRIVNPAGEVITTWRYNKYAETEWF